MNTFYHKLLFFLGTLYACIGQLSAQDIEKFTGRFSETLLEDVIVQLESKSSYRFYYVDSWIDSVFVRGTFENTPIPEVIHRLLEDTPLFAFIEEDKVILTQNRAVITQLPPDFFKPDSSANTNISSYTFRQEKTDETPQKNTPSNTALTLNIGPKSRFDPASRATLSGYVREKSTGEPLTGVLIFSKDPLVTFTTDQFGFYSLTLFEGEYTIQTQYAGMVSQKQKVNVYSSGTLDWQLESEVRTLKEVIIESDQDINVAGIQMGKDRLDLKNIKNIPKVLGENDVLKVALTLPGVQTIGEGAAGFNVRGGNADQNLILLNEATVYNPSHFLGFFSIFNGDVIKSTEIYKSSIPVQQGSRLSAVFDVQMRDGNSKQFSGKGGLSPVTARLSLEGPIIKDRTSFLLGGRTTYSNWILRSLPGTSSLSNSRASFYDVVGKISHKVNEKNSLSLSGYLSGDQFQLNNDSLILYQNINLSFQWRHNFSNKLLGLLTTTYSRYTYDVEKDQIPVEAFRAGFSISEYQAKLDFFYYYSQKHKFDFGIQSKLYRLNPGFIEGLGEASVVKREDIGQENALEHAIFFADHYDINSRLSLYLGLRYSLFTLYGPKTLFNYLPGAPIGESNVQDSTQFNAGEQIVTYHGPEARISARYALNTNSSLKLSYNRTRQYVHLLSNTIAVAPTDTWKLSDPFIQPQRGDQLSLGFYKNFRNNQIETSIEIYYKWLDNLLDFKTGASLALNANLETEVLQGTGKAYGVEVFLKKKTGKLQGWMSYTFSRTLLRLDSNFPQERINGGDFFPANYDKPHNVNLVSEYKFTRRYSLALNVAYSTGRPFTYPVGRYQLNGEEIIQYSTRNQFRIPNYFRIDLGFTIEGNHKVAQRYHSNWTFSIYNVLGRKNPYSIFFAVENNEIRGYQLAIFGAPIPTITYNFSF